MSKMETISDRPELSIEDTELQSILANAGALAMDSSEKGVSLILLHFSNLPTTFDIFCKVFRTRPQVAPNSPKLNCVRSEFWDSQSKAWIVLFCLCKFVHTNPSHGIIYILQGFSVSASGSTSFTSQDLLGIESSASRAPSSTGRDSVSDTESSLDGANPRLVAVTELYFVYLLVSVTNIDLTYSYTDEIETTSPFKWTVYSYSCRTWAALVDWWATKGKLCRCKLKT